MRTKAERKHNNFKKIRHKIHILRDVYGDDGTMRKHDLYDKEKNRLNKAKVHCSCHMCSSKSKTCGMRHSDKVKSDRANYCDKTELENVDFNESLDSSMSMTDQEYYPEREY